MSFVELLVLLALGAVVWFWFDSLKAREIGIEAARRACTREGVQFLDETVAGQGLRLARDDNGRVLLRRGYAFEYSVGGDDRNAGSVVLEGREVVLVDVSAHRLARRAVVDRPAPARPVGLAPALLDRAQELVARLLRTFELAGEGLGDHAFVAAAVLAEQQAELFGLDHAGRARGVAVAHQRVGDVARHPLLVGEAVADRVHQAGDAAKAVQAAAWQVGDVGDATERDEVMRTHAMDRDAANHHHVAARILEAVTEHLGGVELVAPEQAPLPELAHALRGASGMGVVGGDAARTQQVADGLLEGGRVEGAAARNADAGGAGRVGVVVTAGVVRGRAHGGVRCGALRHPSRHDTRKPVQAMNTGSENTSVPSARIIRLLALRMSGRT